MPPAGTPSASSEPGDRIVPPALRPKLAELYGPVLAGADADAKLRGLGLFASCGDRVTADALRLGHPPFVGVVDGKTQRNEPVDPTVFAPLAARRRMTVANPPGVLTLRLRATVRALIDAGGGLLEVDGEEDLASLALVESMPAGATVIYGIPGAGVSFVTVDATAKDQVRTLIAAMQPGRS